MTPGHTEQPEAPESPTSLEKEDAGENPTSTCSKLGSLSLSTVSADVADPAWVQTSNESFGTPGLSGLFLLDSSHSSPTPDHVERQTQRPSSSNVNAEEGGSVCVGGTNPDGDTTGSIGEDHKDDSLKPLPLSDPKAITTAYWKSVLRSSPAPSIPRSPMSPSQYIRTGHSLLNHHTSPSLPLSAGGLNFSPKQPAALFTTASASGTSGLKAHSPTVAVVRLSSTSEGSSSPLPTVLPSPPQPAAQAMYGNRSWFQDLGLYGGGYCGSGSYSFGSPDGSSPQRLPQGISPFAINSPLLSFGTGLSNVTPFSPLIAGFRGSPLKIPHQLNGPGGIPCFGLMPPPAVPLRKNSLEMPGCVEDLASAESDSVPLPPATGWQTTRMAKSSLGIDEEHRSNTTPHTPEKDNPAAAFITKDIGEPRTSAGNRGADSKFPGGENSDDQQYPNSIWGALMYSSTGSPEDKTVADCDLQCSVTKGVPEQGGSSTKPIPIQKSSPPPPPTGSSTLWTPGVDNAEAQVATGTARTLAAFLASQPGHLGIPPGGADTTRAGSLLPPYAPTGVPQGGGHSLLSFVDDQMAATRRPPPPPPLRFTHPRGGMHMVPNQTGGTPPPGMPLTHLQSAVDPGGYMYNPAAPTYPLLPGWNHGGLMPPPMFDSALSPGVFGPPPFGHFPLRAPLSESAVVRHHNLLASGIPPSPPNPSFPLFPFPWQRPIGEPVSPVSEENPPCGLDNSLGSGIFLSEDTVLGQSVDSRKGNAPLLAAMLAHPDEFKNPSSFLKVYGDPACVHNDARPPPKKGRDGNWECPQCQNVNYPRRFRCNRDGCGTDRDREGDKIVSEYARVVYSRHIMRHRGLPPVPLPPPDEPATSASGTSAGVGSETSPPSTTTRIVNGATANCGEGLDPGVSNNNNNLRVIS